MHISMRHLRKLFAEWFALLLQIGTNLLQLWIAIKNRRATVMTIYFVLDHKC